MSLVKRMEIGGETLWARRLWSTLFLVWTVNGYAPCWLCVRCGLIILPIVKCRCTLERGVQVL